MTKSKEGRGRFAIGGQHKLAGIDGAAFGFECTRPLSRSNGGQRVEGRATITVHKDRPGWVRSRCRDGIIGTLELTAWPDGGITARIGPPDELSSAPDPTLRRSILVVVKQYDGCSKSHIEQSVPANAATVRAATSWLVGQALIEVRKENVAHRHYLTDAGRDALDELDEVSP